ncbi:MAG: carboxypeptidase-like regulatory domain-containing protein [Holophagales bacterium]|jgi:hypothetical protein|nr:carboxypeptidase-like regulatory domain-containing protein [Holophagales bacterium]
MLQKLLVAVLGVLCAFPCPAWGQEVGTAAKNCLIEVRVTDTDGGPLQGASVFLTMPYVGQKTIPGVPSTGDDKSMYSLSVDDSIGLYIFFAVAPGRRVASFPVVAKGKSIKLPDIVLPKADAPMDAAISVDAKTCRWAAIWQGYVARRRKSNASFMKALESSPVFQMNKIGVLDANIYSNNWGGELNGLSKEMAAEKDKETRAFLAACYIELGFDSMAWQPQSVDQALRHLDDVSPFWSLCPQMPLTAINSAGGLRQQGAMLFLSRMEKRHPDPEVRAWAMVRRVEEADAKSYAAERKKLGRQVAERFPETEAARFIKARFPYDFE